MQITIFPNQNYRLLWPLITIWLFSTTVRVQGQSLPVGSLGVEDALRRGQLLGKFDCSASFSARPFFPYQPNKIDEFDQAIGLQYSPKHNIGQNSKIWQPVIKILPLTWKQQLNSDHPEGINDGAMIPARGYQTYVSGGFFAKWGWLSLQLQPELVWAQNSAFDGLSDSLSNSVWKIFNTYYIKMIDQPERFGNEAYLKIFWGQSSIRLTYKFLSIGLSNENLWWGPGIKNSLLMTNNAPGFKHLTFNTIYPLKTIIGSFEGQLVCGKLEASGFPGIDTLRLKQHGISYFKKPDDWRYFNGIVLSYQPRWLPGLFVGASRSFIVYHNKLGNGLSDYLPVIIPMTKKAIGQAKEDSISRDQLASVFLRWMAPESHMEVYFEYGREDHNYDMIDLILEPDHIRAYIAGFRKLTPFINRKDEFIDFQLEVATFAKNQATSIRAPGCLAWYNHGLVFDGYTNAGQILGSGIGSGSNMQSLYIGWIRGLKKIGLEFKRVAHEENFWAYALKDYRMHWVDLGGAAIVEWNLKNLLIRAKFETIGSHNYQWNFDPVPSTPGEAPLWWDHGKVRYNLHAELGLTYCF